MSGLDEPATPEQRRKIAQLNMALGNRDYTEEGIITKGQAGKLIRRMVQELEGRKRLQRLGLR